MAKCVILDAVVKEAEFEGRVDQDRRFRTECAAPGGEEIQEGFQRVMWAQAVLIESISRFSFLKAVCL